MMVRCLVFCESVCGSFADSETMRQSPLRLAVCASSLAADHVVIFAIVLLHLFPADVAH